MTAVQKNAFLRMNVLNKIKTQRICAKHLKFFYQNQLTVSSFQQGPENCWLNY